VLAGRRAGPIETLSAELSLPARVFDLGDVRAAAAAPADMEVVAHCAGPFSATCAPMIDACLMSRTHYLDITGELDVFVAAQRRHADAQVPGIVICPGVASMSSPLIALPQCSRRRGHSKHRLRLVRGCYEIAMISSS
jgi:short subunit dehydrogenase-like uncharacterized protein